MKTTAVIVTYNRLTLVKRTIDALRRQTHPLDSIIVVDNGATDGTHEWLDTQKDLTVIHQDNVGGSGGFWRGIQEAHARGFDWLWCMDDDVFPEPDCLERLLAAATPDDGILCPLRRQAGKTFLSEVRRFNLTNPFRSLHCHALTLADIEGHEAVSIEGVAFEGPLIRRDVVTKIGLPNKDLFLLYDDSDYSLRTVLAGYRVRLITAAVLNKELFFANDDVVTARQKGKWKLFYHIRNTVYFNRTYGRNWLVRTLRPLAVLLEYELYVFKNLPFNNKYTLQDARGGGKNPFDCVTGFNVYMMHHVAYRSDIFTRINYHQTEGISYTDMEWVFHPMSQVRTAYFFDRPIYRYLVERTGQTCDPTVRCKHLDQEVTVLMRMLTVLRDIPASNPAYDYLNRVINYRVWTIYGMGLAKEATLDLNAFDAMLLRDFPEVYRRADRFVLDVGLLGLKFRFIHAWRRVRSRKKLKLFPRYVLFCLMSRFKK